MINPSQQSTYETMNELSEAIDLLKGVNNLLIVQCDDIAEQKEHIARYEILRSPDILRYRVSIQVNSPTPSLYSALSDLVLEHDSLQQHRNALITVLGTEMLHGDPLKHFIGSLEYRREQILRLPFTIVLWVNSETLQAIQQKAPTFYQNARGVFRF